MPFDFVTLKRSFFDVVKIQDEAERLRLRGLSKFGAYVRQRARTSIRKRKKISEPGKPPSSHAGELKKLIFFAYDSGTRSVVVGPALFKRGGVPSLLEYGGTIVRKLKGGAVRRLVYRPRPYMSPALEAERPKFTQVLKSLV